jgi:hypothetical protein
VHFGELVSRSGKECVLNNARRIWHWKGANTLNEVALHGVSEESRVSEPVPSNTLTEAIELIPMSEAAISRCAISGLGQVTGSGDGSGSGHGSGDGSGDGTGDGSGDGSGDGYGDGYGYGDGSGDGDGDGSGSGSGSGYGYGDGSGYG